MGLKRISTGAKVLDNLLDGGFETDAISTVYGPAGSGKTNTCILCASQVAREGKKVIYVDTEGGFSISRLKQISPDDYEKLLGNMFFLKPDNFDEQKRSFEKLKNLVNDQIGLIIVDSISMLYRLEFGRDENFNSINKDLAEQLYALNEIARKKNIPVIITNQVYSSFDRRDEVNMVGGDFLKNYSKCLLELRKHHKNIRSVILKKHRSLPESEAVNFEIVNEGFKEIEKN